MLSATIPIGAIVVPGVAAAQRAPSAAERDRDAARRDARPPAAAEAQLQSPAAAEAQVQPAAAAKAQVGAGTTAGTTNGASQALAHNGRDGKPPLPQPKLCDAYRGETREHCLEVVLRGDRDRAAQRAPAAE
jgi:hypothetical protein